MKKIAMLCPADSWFFIHEAAGKLNYMRVVVWATDDAGQAVGLVSVASEGGLLTPPPASVKGKYMHFSDLSVEQQANALKVSGISNQNVM